MLFLEFCLLPHQHHQLDDRHRYNFVCAKFDDQETIIAAIKENLRKFLNIETAVRLTLDTELSNPERTIIAVPFQSDDEQILSNFAQLLYQSILGYYISAEPRSSHFGNRAPVPIIDGPPSYETSERRVK